MNREQIKQALESGCAVYREGYTVEPEVIFRVRVDRPGMPWTRWDTIEEALDDLVERFGSCAACDGTGSIEETTDCRRCGGTGRRSGS